MAVIKHEAQRVGVFIDAQNLYHSAKNLYRGRVNFTNIMKHAVAGRTLVRAVAYVIKAEGGEEQGFFDALGKIGIETKVKDLQVFSGGAKKADWDVGMAIDAVSMADKFDAIVLVTGDGDFVPLVEYLKLRGCQVEAVAYGRSAALKLKESVHAFVDMCEDPRTFVIGYRGEPRGRGRSTRSTGRGAAAASEQTDGTFSDEPISVGADDIDS